MAEVEQEDTTGENAEDRMSPEQNTPVSVLALAVLLLSSSTEWEENVVLLRVELDDTVGAGDGLELIPKRRRMASPTQSLHFC